MGAFLSHIKAMKTIDFLPSLFFCIDRVSVALIKTLNLLHDFSLAIVLSNTLCFCPYSSHLLSHTQGLVEALIRFNPDIMFMNTILQPVAVRHGLDRSVLVQWFLRNACPL